MRFDNNFRTTVPTSELIADYQTLALAVRDYTNGWSSQEDLLEEIEQVMNHLNKAIEHQTPSHSGMTPSGYSIIMPEVSNGLYLTDEGKELTCACGNPIGEIVKGQCGDCPHIKQSGCCPTEFKIVLANGLRYDGTSNANKALRAMEE